MQTPSPRRHNLLPLRAFYIIILSHGKPPVRRCRPSVSPQETTVFLRGKRCFLLHKPQVSCINHSQEVILPIGACASGRCEKTTQCDVYLKFTKASNPTSRRSIAEDIFPSSLKVILVDSNTADIKNVRKNEDDIWYTLDGIKLNGNPVTKGVYIKNGKKVVK